jgi:hypothetical protein
MGNYSSPPFQLFLYALAKHYSGKKESPSGDKLMQVRRGVSG